MYRDVIQRVVWPVGHRVMAYNWLYDRYPPDLWSQHDAILGDLHYTNNSTPSRPGIRVSNPLSVLTTPTSGPSWMVLEKNRTSRISRSCSTTNALHLHHLRRNDLNEMLPINGGSRYICTLEYVHARSIFSQWCPRNFRNDVFSQGCPFAMKSFRNDVWIPYFWNVTWHLFIALKANFLNIP